MPYLSEEELESTCTEIIGYVGAAKSSYIDSISKAKSGNIDEARDLITAGNEAYLKGHNVHSRMLQEDAAGSKKTFFSLLLLHTEDQMMDAETFRIIASDFIDVYDRLQTMQSAH